MESVKDAALKVANESVKWAREYVAAGKVERARKSLDRAIEDAHAELAKYQVREPFPGSIDAVKAGLEVLVAARAEVA